MASEQTRLSTIRGYQLNLRPTSSPDTGSHLRDHEKPSAAVVGGAVISFVDGVDEDIKADVLNTLLFAQLVADGQADRQKEPDQWYAVFRDVLETIGWVITGFNFVEKNLSNMAVSVASMVINSLQANLTAPQLAAVQRVVDFLRELAETDPRVRLFNTHSTSVNRSNFQLGACSVSQDGSAVLTMGAFRYSVESQIANALFAMVNRGSSSFFSSSQTLQLSKANYNEQTRQQVLEKLGNEARLQIRIISKDEM